MLQLKKRVRIKIDLQRERVKGQNTVDIGFRTNNLRQLISRGAGESRYFIKSTQWADCHRVYH